MDTRKSEIRGSAVSNDESRQLRDSCGYIPKSRLSNWCLEFATKLRANARASSLGRNKKAGFRDGRSGLFIIASATSLAFSYKNLTVLSVYIPSDKVGDGICSVLGGKIH